LDRISKLLVSKVDLLLVCFQTGRALHLDGGQRCSILPRLPQEKCGPKEEYSTKRDEKGDTLSAPFLFCQSAEFGVFITHSDYLEMIELRAKFYPAGQVVHIGIIAYGA
jgi:hypothetical protein